MDGRELDAFMMWAAVVSLICLMGIPAGVLSVCLRAWRRSRLHRRNLAVVAMIENLQAMHELESGVDRE